LTYELHLDDGEPAAGNDAAPELFTPLPNGCAFYRAFEELLENLEVRKIWAKTRYPIKDDVKHVYNLLKGSDAVVYSKSPCFLI